MVKKCPPGVFCIENLSLIFLIIIILILSYLFYLSNNRKGNNIIVKEKINPIINPVINSNYLPSFDILKDPYTAPLRNDNIIREYPIPQLSIPINIQTQGIDASYRQIGILTRMTGKEQILPLMGKPLITNRDKWNFYTMTDKNNMIKLPVSNKGRSCTNEYGCDNIYNGDTVYVEGYNDAFKATIYDNDTIRYIPFL